MTEENNLEQEGANFADMLAAHEEEQASNRLEVGQKVQARVVAITTDTVFVSTGSKVDGLVERAELEHDGVVEVKEGDVLDLFVVHVSSQEVRLSRVVRGSGSLNLLEDAKASAIPVEGKVTGVVKGGFSVDVMRRRAFCPLSQIDARPVETPEALVGQIFKFLVTRLEKGGRNIVVSRRGLIEAEQAESREAFLAGVKEGDVLEGAVRRLTQFGAFVELAPGVEGMVHVSELSWSRVRQPDEMIGVGDQVRVKVLALGKTEKGWRLSLSMRQVTEDPWLSVADRLHSGDLVRGKVARASSFGAFVEVLPGIEGLIHISELSWEKRVNKAEEVVTVGEEVLVKVKEVDAEKRRVSLSLRDAAGDPWAAVPADFPVGSEHKGVVEKRAAFGLFICLAPGVTGLMPNSMMGPRGNNKYAKLGAGMEAEVRISEMNLEARKLTLAPAGVEEDEIMSAAPDRSARDGVRSEGRRGEGGRGRDGRPGKGGSRKEGDDWKQHAKAESSSGSFGGSLGAALADALKKKTEK